jgi:hypothetical protein
VVHDLFFLYQVYGIITINMELDPHALHEIVQRIDKQMRCPQCGKDVPVDIPSVRVSGEDFLLLQLKCATCDAYIVLHAAISGAETIGISQKEGEVHNASSRLHLNKEELGMLRSAMKESGGSFESVFKKYGKKEKGSGSGSGSGSGVAS